MSRIMAAVNEPRPKFTEVRGVSLGGRGARPAGHGDISLRSRLEISCFRHSGKKAELACRGRLHRVSFMMPRGTNADDTDDEARSIPLGLQPKLSTTPSLPPKQP